jgi:hypothetical protein
VTGTLLVITNLTKELITWGYGREKALKLSTDPVHKHFRIFLESHVGDHPSSPLVNRSIGLAAIVDPTDPT